MDLFHIIISSCFWMNIEHYSSSSSLKQNQNGLLFIYLFPCFHVFMFLCSMLYFFYQRFFVVSSPEKPQTLGIRRPIQSITICMSTEYTQCIRHKARIVHRCMNTEHWLWTVSIRAYWNAQCNQILSACYQFVVLSVFSVQFILSGNHKGLWCSCQCLSM